MLNRKNSFYFILASLIVMPFTLSFAENAVEPKISINKILSHFTTYAEQSQKEWHVPGMSIAIVKDNKIIYARGFGKCNVEGALVTPDTID